MADKSGDLYVTNPLTGRRVLRTGAAYQNYLKTIATRELSELSDKLGGLQLESKTDPVLVDAIYDIIIKRGRYELDPYPSKEPYGNPDAPVTQEERKQVLKECGEACFLRPSTLNFPICKKTVKGSPQTCHVTCKGLTSAIVKANTHNYVNISASAAKLYKGLGCRRP